MATHFISQDCCCKYCNNIEVSISVESFYVGTKSDPLASAQRNIQKYLLSSAAKTEVADLISDFLPECRRAERQECDDWAQDAGDNARLRLTLQDSICAMIRDKAGAIVNPQPPRDGDGLTSTVDMDGLKWWGGHPGGSMSQACAEDFVDIETIRIKTFLCTALKGREYRARKRQIVNSLQEASTLLMQCCIRIDPDDILLGAIDDLDGDGCAADPWGGVGIPADPYIINLVVLDDQEADINSQFWVGRQKGQYGGGEAGLGGEGLSMGFGTRAGSYSWGRRIAIFTPKGSIGGRLIAHEIGHCAGLASNVNLPNDPPEPHRDYDSRIHIMGSSADEGHRDPDTNTDDQGLSWKSADCLTLRAFASQGTPPWLVD